MRLGDLITAETKINEEILIGKELELLEGETLLLAIQKGEFFVESEDAVCPATRILALYEPPADEEDDEWEDDAWDDGEFGLDEDAEVITNRQAIINQKEEFEPELLDVNEIIINGKGYQVFEVEESFMEDQPRDAVEALKRADEAGVISEKWQDKVTDDMTLVEYIVEDSMMDVAWQADILAIDFGFSDENDDNEMLCGKVFECSAGKLDVPIAFDITSPAGDKIPARIYGVHMLDVWRDAHLLGLDEDELEEMCAPDERLLAVEYDVDADAILNFYTKDYLDKEARDGDELPELMLGMEDHELRLIDVVPEDFDGEVELELMSYEIFED